MPTYMDFGRQGQVLAKLKGLSLEGRKQATVRVQYGAPYAVYVHENLQANHPNGGQAKFLEDPARRLRFQMRLIVIKAVQQKKGLLNGLQQAGELLLEESRKLVPVKTGRLRRSGRVLIKEGE